LIFDLHRKAGKPFTCRSSPYGQPFDLAFYGSMELDLDITNLGKIELTSIELEPLLRIGKRIVPTSSPKSWISRILSGFDSSEERLQGKIHPFLGILKGLGKDIVKFRLLFFPSWKKIVRLVLGYGFAFFLPSIFSVC